VANAGVELFWVEGTYLRATSRDNPDEAAQVAERSSTTTTPAQPSAWAW
jgi:hypothetical protein